MITINPENPSSDDPVVFELTINGCFFEEVSKSIHASQHVFKADFVGVDCHIWIPPLTWAWQVGRLQAGEYEVILTQDNFEPVHQVFSVSEGLLPFPEPAIPTVGIAGGLILAIGLVWQLLTRRLSRTRQAAPLN